MKITIKNKDCCQTKKVWLEEEFENKLYAKKALMDFYNQTNERNGDCIYNDTMSAIEKMLEEEEQGEIFGETVKKSLLEFGLKHIYIASYYYYVIVKHGIRYFIPDSLTPEQDLQLAIDLVNSGDQIVEIIPDLELTYKHYRGNTNIFINGEFYNWVWSDIDFGDYDSLQDLIDYLCDDLYKYVHKEQQEEMKNKIVFEFTGRLFSENW